MASKGARGVVFVVDGGARGYGYGDVGEWRFGKILGPGCWLFVRSSQRGMKRVDGVSGQLGRQVVFCWCSVPNMRYSFLFMTLFFRIAALLVLAPMLWTKGSRGRRRSSSFLFLLLAIDRKAAGILVLMLFASFRAKEGEERQSKGARERGSTESAERIFGCSLVRD